MKSLTAYAVCAAIVISIVFPIHLVKAQDTGLIPAGAEPRQGISPRAVLADRERNPDVDAASRLQGADAVNSLKKSGHYDSLMQAVRASRQGDELTKMPQAEEDAIGQSAKLLANDGANSDYFGFTVAISGETAVVGAYLEDTSPNTDNGAAYVFTRSAGGWSEQAKLLANDGAGSDYFGYSVAISGDTIVVGAYEEDTSSNTSNGAAYVFTRSAGTWSQQAKLLASDAATGDNFGWSVAISGETIVVGAYREDTSPNTENGAAYVFTRSGVTWTQQAKLLASDRATDDNFGWSVAISGDTIVVGAYFESTSPNTSNGAAYVFTRNAGAWSQQAKLLASDAASNDHFGYSVAISVDTIVVGAYLESTSPNTTNGAAYVFTRNAGAWSQQVKLLASDAASSDRFGYSVSISGDAIVVGAYREDTPPNTDNGAAYVFTRSADVWSEQTKLLASDAAAFDSFGSSVAISGNNMVVGAQFGDGTNLNQGAAYIFRVLSNNWTQESRKVATDGAANDLFGYSVAVSGDTAVVGAYQEDTESNTNNGAAYVFTRSAGAWTQQAKLLAADAASNDLFGFNVAISGDTIVIGAHQEDTNGPSTDDGAAYVFTRSGVTWTQQAKLVASDPGVLDYFGYSVALSGDTIVVGAYQEDTTPNTGNGAAYVFTRSGVTWTQQAKLLASDAASDEFFGTSVAISGDTIVVGARWEDTVPNSENGAAYVFTRSGPTWTQQAKLLASDAASGDEFGFDVAISGDTIVVGAFQEDTESNTGNGAGYVFTRSAGAWSQQAKLLASDAAMNDYFGSSVAISGDTVVLGAWGEDTPPNGNNGAAYVFSRSGGAWSQQAKLLASGAETFDSFGIGVAISGDKIIVGAPYSDASTSTPLTSNRTDSFVPQAADQGAVFMFVNTLIPTAANVSVGGRVTAEAGSGLRNAVVTLTEADGSTHTTRTGSFGYYRFDDIASGQTVVISVGSKRYQFQTQLIAIGDDNLAIDFMPMP
jgi:hypothetical protein